MTGKAGRVLFQFASGVIRLRASRRTMRNSSPAASKSFSLADWLNLLECGLVDSHTAVIIPFDFRVIFVRPLNCPEFSTRFTEVAQALNAVSGSQFQASTGGFGERRFL